MRKTGVSEVSKQENCKIITINPGSTSTKVAYFEGDEMVFSKTIEHDASELAQFENVTDQYDYRKEAIARALREANVPIDDVRLFAARVGGLFGCVGGVYEITPDGILLEHSVKGTGLGTQRPNQLGAPIASAFAVANGGRAFAVNPPDVDEFIDIARITGIPGIYRESRIHALNQKENAIRYAKSIGRRYEDLDLVVCHIGGGVSVTAHCKGKMVDSNDIIGGDGPMAPTRSGAIPAKSMIGLCFSEELSRKEIRALLNKQGGFVAHLGTADAREIRKMIDGGDEYAKLVYDAFIYQIAKYAASCFAPLGGHADAIILTGGIANDEYLVEKIREYLGDMAPIVVQPGEFEHEALCAGVLRVLEGEEELQIYTGVPVFTEFERTAHMS